MLQRLSLFFAVLIFTSSCTSPQKKFEKRIARGECTEALENMPRNDHRIQLLGDIETGFTKGMSYALSGAGHTVDFITTITTGIPTVTLVCSPGIIAFGGLIAFAAVTGVHPFFDPEYDSSKYSGSSSKKSNTPEEKVSKKSKESNSPFCIDTKLKKYYYNPKLGKKAFRKTQDWRCPDFSTVRKAFQDVATCYQKKNTSKAYEQALKTLDSIQKNVLFYECLGAKERSKVEYQAKELRLLLEKS